MYTVIASITGGYTGYDGIQNLASKTYVNTKVSEVEMQFVQSEIQRYETELMKIAILTETDSDKPIDRLMKTRAEQQLTHLRTLLSDLRSKH